ncbi:MAG: hypothetical protein OEV92_13815 [Nitrospinota bacterium]|nr:hypothetical protein [Nitrospinota bacterium]
MEEIINKLVDIEKYVSEEKGGFSLFALFLREDAPDVWDLLVSAPWIGKDRSSVLKYLTDVIHSRFAEKELLKLSRIVIIENDNPALQAIHRTVNTEHKNTEIIDCNFFGLDIKHAYLITSKKLESSETAA